ncbi:MAG: CinA family protein [Alphaproteobacteria bacterium]|nr:CinA family protein [Alphaproteobacteria bacterium]
MFTEARMAKAEEILKKCGDRHWRLSAAESCTGGLFAALMTEVPGSSVVLGRSFVTYSNRAKREVLNVPAALLEQHGAVSEPVVEAMAQNLFDMTTAHLTIAVSGVAGPGGGSTEKPVGTVHMATATADGIVHIRQSFGDIGRREVRLATLDAGLDMLLHRLN